MSGYTSDQINALQGYINAAQAALNSGNSNGVVSALNQYYGAQTSMRGYATDALQVLNNTGVFGHVANQELINSLGQDRYNSIRTTLAFDLANSDLALIKQHPNAVPTENEIADYHNEDFNRLNIDPTAWGGATGAALGADWAQGTLTAAEINSDLTKNTFAQNFTSTQTLTAMNKLIQAGINTIPLASSSDIADLSRGFRDILVYQGIYDLKYNTNVFQWDPSKINFDPSSQTITSGQNGGQFLTVVTSADHSNVLYVGSAITQGDGSTGLYLSSTGAPTISSEPFATVTSTSTGTGSQFALSTQPNQNQIVLSDQTTGNGTNFALTAGYDPVSGEVSSETLAGNNFQINSSGNNINFSSGASGRLIGDFDNVNLGNSATLALVGQGSAITAQYASLTLDNGSSATISGTGNTVTLTDNVAGTVIGSGNSINGQGTGNTVVVGGNGMNASGAAMDMVSLAQGGTVIETANSHVDVNGNNVTDNIGTNDTLGAYGSGVTVNASGTGDLVWTGGNGQGASDAQDDHVSFAQGGNLNEIDNSRIDVNGDNVTDTIGNHDNIGTNGSGVTVNASGSGDGIWAGGQNNNINGSGENITYAANTRGDISGNNNTVTLQGNTGDHLGVDGTGEVVTGDSGSNHVNLQGDDSNATIDGGGVVGMTGSNQTLTLGDQGSTVQTAPGLQGETISGSGETIDALGSISGSNVVGSNDTLNLAANSGSGIGLSGTGDVVNGADGNYIPIYDAGASTIVNGAGSVALDASGQSLTLGTSGANINTAAGVQNEGITGSGESISLASGVSATVSGANDTVGMGGNTNTYAAILGQNQTVTGDAGNDVVNLAGAGTSATVDGGGYVGLVGNNESLTLGNSGSSVQTAPNVQNEAINGSGETINFASNASGTVGGNNDTINGPDGGDLISINGQNDAFYGNNDSVNIEGYDNIVALNGDNDLFFENGSYEGGTEEDGSYDGDGGFDGGYEEWGDDDPLILNLQDNPVQTVGAAQSPAHFDMQNDGHPVQTGWGTPGEGYLVDDPSGSQTVTDAADLVPTFAALQTLDTNHDGVLDAHDAAWSDLKVWVDASGTAASQPGSLHSLSDLGIVSIDLNTTPAQRMDNGNTILADGTFTWADGSHGNIADVALRFLPNQPSGSAATASTDPATQTQASQLVAAMSTFGVSSASESTVQTSAPAAQASLTVDPTAAQAHRLAA